MTENFKNTLIWLTAGTIAVLAAMYAVSASFHVDEYVPVSNDSFYHARRILDTVEDPDQFFEFDERIHVPEGSWIAWPWLYDYAVAGLVRGIAKLSGAENPVPILMYVPVFWAYVTIGLVLLLTLELKLSLAYRALACTAVALSPMTQMLHGTGLVDHHYMEYTFVLLTVLGGMRWFSDPGNIARATFLGFVLGIATGFHNAMFILQLPVIAGVYVLWMGGHVWSPRAIGFFVASLLIGTLLVLLPSEPFWEGFFAYYYLSSFHLYIAICTSVAVGYLANRVWSMRSLVIISGVGLLLLLPMLQQIWSMESFLAKDITRFDIIMETKSPLELSLGGPRLWLVDFFSLLVLLTPFVWLAAAWTVFRGRAPDLVFFSIMVLFGLSLFFLQVRLHYFGSFAVFIGPLLLATWLQQAKPRRQTMITIAVVLVYVAAMAGPATNRLFRQLPLGMDAQYGLVQTAIPALKDACREEPGLVLAYNDLGHYIRYHTECSVIANNFLLTAQHERKIEELDELFSMGLDSLLVDRPDIRYIFVSFPFLMLNLPDGRQVPARREDLRAMNGRWPLMVDLLLGEDEPDDRLQVLSEVRMKDGERDFAIVRLFRVLPGHEMPTAALTGDSSAIGNGRP